MVALYPSLISSNLMNLQKTVDELTPFCTGFHIDIMDGHFVPNLTWGPAFVNTLRAATQKQLWIHLMVTNPALLILMMQLNSGDMVTIHYESCTTSELKKLLAVCKEQNLNTGLALKPGTAVDALKPFVNIIDHVLIMSVEPGFSGQAFLPDTFKKIDQLNHLKKELHASFTLAIDGGVTQENAKTIIKHGVEQIALASALFAQNDPVDALKKITLALQTR